MDKYLHNDEERLFDLLEQKDAEQLTDEERAFAERHLPLAEYALQRRILLEAADIYAAVPEPGPLAILPPAKGLKGKTVPLYQAVAAVAATVALFLSLWPDPQQPDPRPAGSKIQLGKTDTVFRTQIVIDTVIRYIERREKHYAEQTPDRAPDAIVQAAQLQMPEAGPIPLPEITEELIRTKGSSLKDDETTKAVMGSVYQSTTW